MLCLSSEALQEARYRDGALAYAEATEQMAGDGGQAGKGGEEGGRWGEGYARGGGEGWRWRCFQGMGPIWGLAGATVPSYR